MPASFISAIINYVLKMNSKTMVSIFYMSLSLMRCKNTFLLQGILLPNQKYPVLRIWSYQQIPLYRHFCYTIQLHLSTSCFMLEHWIQHNNPLFKINTFPPPTELVQQNLVALFSSYFLVYLPTTNHVPSAAWFMETSSPYSLNSPGLQTAKNTCTRYIF